MSQCLRCSKFCESYAVFCEECRSFLSFQLRQRPYLYAAQGITSSSSQDASALPDNARVQGNPLESPTSPLNSNRVDEITQSQTVPVQSELSEQTVTKLNQVANLIEQEEDQFKLDRKPRLHSRASRLSPIVDGSADVRRANTSLPKISREGDNSGTASSLIDAHSALSDCWPWLGDDFEEKENDLWKDRTDPLISRRIPTSTESVRIEEDIRHTEAKEASTKLISIPLFRRHASRLHIAFIALAFLALLALFVDAILLDVAFHNSRPKASATHGYPTLTLSINTASRDTKVILTLKYFTPFARVVLTRDIQESITINGNSSITTNAQGNATFLLYIDAAWGPGYHLIVAEDVKSRSTASANIQIINKGTSRPAHLLLDTSSLAMDADYAGTNTIRPFTLRNSGDGSISWSVSSDAPWLLVAPRQGIFSQQEVISVAVQRLGLKPGDYHSALTISSSVSPAEHISVEMSVQTIRSNIGPVLAVTPALLPFTASDGQLNTMQQTLTISNPGSQPLNWSLQPTQGLTCPWLRASPAGGIVSPGATQSLSVDVQSNCLLPGTYSSALTFAANRAIDSSQQVYVSLIVQPHCGLVTSTGFLAFTVVAGNTTLANQSLSLNATASCGDTPLSWKASSTENWLSMTPGNGQVQGNVSSVVTASVNAAGLQASPNPYYAHVSFVFGQDTLTVLVKLTVEMAQPMEPIMSVSPLSLNFSNIQGQPDPTGQVVAITNSGRSTLNWHVTATPFPSFVWIAATPLGGTIAPGQTRQVTVQVNTSQLTPGNYVGQILLNGTDTEGKLALGNPQIIVVNLVIQPPCTISPPSSSALLFSAVQGTSAPIAAQSVLFTGMGSCVWPLLWKTSVAPTASWLRLTTSSGTIGGAGQSGNVALTANISGLVTGTYSTAVTITASDSSNVIVQGSIQTFTVTLTILPPCVLSVPSPNRLTFTVNQGQSSSWLTVTLSESGTCARPVTWTASSDANSSAWIVLSKSSGLDSGGGSTFKVNVNATSLSPGNYIGTIVITATNSSGSNISASGRKINVSLQVA